MKKNTSKRKTIYTKSNGSCAYCGIDLKFEDFTIDHIHPRIKGGSNELSNLICSCKSCNSSKGSKSLEEYRLFLILNKSKYSGIITPKQLKQLVLCGVSFDLDDHVFYQEDKLNGMAFGNCNRSKGSKTLEELTYQMD